MNKSCKFANIPYCIKNVQIDFFLEQLYKKNQSFLDKKFEKEIKKDFYSRTWELCLSELLCSIKHESKLQPSRSNKNGEGPDFRLYHNGVEFIVEAASIKHGAGNDQIVFKTISESNVANLIEKEPMQLRLLNTFGEKIKQYKKWLSKDIITTTTPFVIAVSLGRLELGLNYSDEEIIETVLEINLANQKYITKKSGAKVSKCVFLQNEYEYISAIIISRSRGIRSNDILNANLDLGAQIQSEEFFPLLDNDLFLVHNPMALNCLSKNAFNIRQPPDEK